MSKYIKLEDMENLIINIAPDGDVFTREMLALQNLPTTEIVRCKDCKHWHELGNGTGACHRGGFMWVGSDYDDYCSFGERIESED